MVIFKCLILVFIVGFSVTLARYLDSTGNEILSEESNDFELSNKTEFSPISCNISFSGHAILVTRWSKTKTFLDNPSKIFVLDFSPYATSMDDFIQKYPTFIIETEGVAYSEATFGDLGKGHFGNLTFPTYIAFNRNRMFHEYMVLEEMNKKFFYVYAAVGIGFVKENSKLYVEPFIFGRISGMGGYKRSLEIGLKLNVITFYPKTNSMFDEIYIEKRE